MHACTRRARACMNVNDCEAYHNVSVVVRPTNKGSAAVRHSDSSHAASRGFGLHAGSCFFLRPQPARECQADDHATGGTYAPIMVRQTCCVATSTDHKVTGQVGQHAGAATWQPQSQPSMLHASAEKRKVLHKHLQLRLRHNGSYCTLG